MILLFWGVFCSAKSTLEIKKELDVIQREIFAEINQYANANGIQVYLGGSTLLKLAFSADAGATPGSFRDLIGKGQDIDLIVDGSRGQLDKFKVWLAANFPDYKWDVGLRRQFASEGFAQQNSDSLSTTFLKLSSDPQGSELLDLAKADNDPTLFLEDISHHEIHFLVTGSHEQSDMYLRHRNPAAFSVLRYLINAASFGAEVSVADVEQVNHIIDDFNPGDIDNDYLRRRSNYYFAKLDKLKPQVNAMLERKGHRLHISELMARLAMYGKPCGFLLGAQSP